MGGKTIDEILVDIGEMNRFQITRLPMLYIMCMPLAFHVLIMFFVSHELPWQCAADTTKCSLNGTFAPGDKDYNFRCNLSRSDWEYAADHEGPRTTIVSDFDLVCSDSVYGWLATSMQFIGMILSQTLIGIISDRYGRLVTLYPSLIVLSVVGVASAFATQYWQFLVTRAIIGVSLAGCLTPLIVLTTEYVGPRYRAVVHIMTWNFWSFAYLVLAGVAYFVREWRTLMIISSAPWILLVAFWRFIPESMRWQATHNKTEKAEETLREIARINKKKYPEAYIYLPKSHEKSATCIELFTVNSLVIKLAILGFLWFAVALVYFGASFGAGDFGGNMYLNFILTSLVEFPANFYGIYSCNRFGRKNTTTIPMLFGGLACIIVSLIPSGTNRTDFIAGRVIGGMIGKGASTVTFAVIPVWSSELFPTVLSSTSTIPSPSQSKSTMGFEESPSSLPLPLLSKRGNSTAIFLILGHTGAFVAPFLIEAKRVHTIVPFAIMGGLAIISGLLCCLLPETKNTPTKEVLEVNCKKLPDEQELQEIIDKSDEE